MGKSVVVTGMGVVSSIGNSLESFWSNLLDGKSGVSAITSFDISTYSTQIGAQIDSESITDGLSVREINRTSRTSLMALSAAKQALNQAQVQDSQFLENMGVIVGSSGAAYAESEPFFEKAFKENRTSPFGILKPMSSAPVTNLTIQYQIKGLSITLDTACSSANQAIGLAAKLIEGGVLDIALVGGVDTAFSPVLYKSWCRLGTMTKKNDEITRACKPFSKNRDGTVLGEGAGMLILESEELANRRGVTPYAFVRGYGASSDAKHLTMPHPEGMSRAMEMCLKQSTISIQDIDYINAHATGTKHNDFIETQAIKSVFGNDAHHIPVSGIKPNLGHALGASAAFEAIACIQSLKTGVIPSMLNYEEFDPECDLLFVTDGASEINPRVCMSNSFGFGGSNTAVLFEKI